MRLLARLAFCVALAAGSASAQPLTIGLQNEPTSADPHFYNYFPNLALAYHFFDPLLRQDERLRLVPMLAESWAPVDETTWEFKLRRGVKFHDGSPFTAEDVAATIRRAPNVPNSPGSLALHTRAIMETVVVDPHTVRFRTDGPAPLLPIDLSLVAITPKSFEHATTADFNAGRAVIGTGPFRLVEFKPGDRIMMTRNEEYWRGKPAWQTVTLRPISNDAARVAALLSGAVDVIESPGTAELQRVATHPQLDLLLTPSQRLIYFHMDSFADRSPFVTDLQGRPMDKNPLKDARVRRALSKAIDRKAIVERVMEGLAVPAGQLLPDDMHGTSPDLKPEPYDPEGARRLLADAGYPNGFGLTIHGPNDRFVNDQQILQAVGAMLTRAGIAAKVEALPYSVYIARASRNEFSMFLLSWQGTGEVSNTLRGMLATPDRERGTGTSNRGRYSNRQMDEVLARAQRTLDEEARNKLLQQATEIVIRDQGMIPLHFQIATWGIRKGLAYLPRSDGSTLAAEIRPR